MGVWGDFGWSAQGFGVRTDELCKQPSSISQYSIFINVTHIIPKLDDLANKLGQRHSLGGLSL